jgi:7,8-dihydroneopterin aldolase/epimerase/oxygenase
VATDRIILEGMIFFGYHGTRPEETTLGQRFVVDVALQLDLRAAGVSDDLAATVDYSAVHQRARAIVEGPPLRLTEAVAERIAAAVLAEHPLVEAVQVRVRKPGVRLDDTVLAGSVVEILRRRP